MRRAALVALVLVAILLSTPEAEAHGLLSASQPQARAVLSDAPPAVMLTFTEAPEPGFSSVQVLDREGGSYGAGRLDVVPGDPQTLRLGVRPLERGVYTVNWRIVSRVDGHLTAGSFAFGVGEAVTDDAVRPAAAGPSNRSVLGVGGRALLYAGLSALFGAAWVGLIAFREYRRPVFVFTLAAWVVAAAGVVALGVAQRHTTGASIGDFLRAPLGRAVLWRALGIGIAGAGVLLARHATGRRWRVSTGVVAVGAAGAIVAHVHSGHAAAASSPWTMVGLQTAHFLAAGGWLGGLAALLVGLGRRPDPSAATTARRYAIGAGVALGVLVVTGLLRALDEVGSWGSLLDTGYGRLILVKSGLLLALAGFGAVNHYRNVPAAGRSLRGLRQVGSAELATAAVVFAVTGFLTTAAPPARNRVPPPSAVVVDGSDFGTTMRVRLSASPGTAGENRFEIKATDYDTGEPVQADRLSARFALPANPAVSETSLDFVEGQPGTYSASGTSLSVPGRWRITVVAQRGTDAVEIPLTLLTTVPKPQVTESRAPGQLTLWDVALSQGRSLQVYADPERPGPTQFHATFFSSEGGELAVDSAAVAVVQPNGVAVAATPRRLGPGHFVVDLDAPAGRWAVELTAVTAGGDYLFVPLDLTIST
ncbi:MAG TPA: FixH family protein [Acidimicrobiales bacterium]|nr:FixH family protein [Acidimicrobiales bacterium]